jgi:hypothetical protein
MTGLDSNYVTYPQLAIVLDGFLVVLLHVIREVVDRNVIVLDILHDLRHHVNIDQKMEHRETNPLLESSKLAGCQGICFSNNRNHVNTRRKTAHQLDVHLPQATSWPS